MIVKIKRSENFKVHNDIYNLAFEIYSQKRAYTEGGKIWKQMTKISISGTTHGTDLVDPSFNQKIQFSNSV